MKFEHGNVPLVSSDQTMGEICLSKEAQKAVDMHDELIAVLNDLYVSYRARAVLREQDMALCDRVRKVLAKVQT